MNEQADVQRFAASLLAQYHNPNRPTKGIGNADPFVIALAATSTPTFTVVTAEKAGSSENPKIPFVCKHLKVECITFLDMMRSEHWRLT